MELLVMPVMLNVSNAIYRPRTVRLAHRETFCNQEPSHARVLVAEDIGLTQGIANAHHVWTNALPVQVVRLAFHVLLHYREI